MSDTVEPTTDRPRRTATPGWRQPRVRAGAVIAIALLIGFVVWLILRGDESSTTSPVANTTGAVPISDEGLKTLADAIGQPIYWAGAAPGMTYELTKTTSNRVFIRYLPSGVEIGSDDPYLTIGTYPVANAFAVTQTVSKRPTSVTIPIGKGGVAFYGKQTPTRVYLAYPGSDFQVEVYSPSAGEAQRLVASDQVVAVAPESSGATAAHAVSRSALEKFAASVEHPVYWAGVEPHMTYELTSLANGRVFIRYLPAGVTVGSREPHLTIGTYPVKSALTVTKQASRGPGKVLIEIGGGGVAFYSEDSANRVYLAYPGSDYQIEVYDPSPDRARTLVAAGRIKPVR